ncbi:MAG: hypothetical protein R2830_18025 [Saprospiraceae bacterium]
MKSEDITKMYSYIITGFLVLAIASGGYFWRNTTQKEQERNAVEMEKESLLVEKGLLSAQLEMLKENYEEAMTENGALKGTIDQNAKAVAEKDQLLAKFTKRTKAEIYGLDQLKLEIVDLQKIKSSLALEIQALQHENQLLSAENERLSGELKRAKNENAALNEKVEELTVMSQNLKYLQDALAPGGISANAFRVEVEKRLEQLTVKGRKAKALSISFDLIEVPKNMQGVQKLYLSITDNKGTPIKGKNNLSAAIGVDNKITDIIAQQAKEISLQKSQRVSFRYPLEQKLMPGHYRATVYTETGWIGSVSFRVG